MSFYFSSVLSIIWVVEAQIHISLFYSNKPLWGKLKAFYRQLHLRRTINNNPTEKNTQKTPHRKGPVQLKLQPFGRLGFHEYRLVAMRSDLDEMTGSPYEIVCVFFFFYSLPDSPLHENDCDQGYSFCYILFFSLHPPFI